jgi:pimeloyl-ACP methyl ester carboxylesterase
MGGKVAQLLASRRPGGLVGLILVAPATPTSTHFPEEALQRQIHAYDNRETVLQTIAFLSARTPVPEIVEQIVEDSLSGVPDAKLAWPTSAIREDISAEVPHIAVPTLVLAGEHDHLDSVEQHRREILTRISNSRLEIIPGSGHLIPIDEPLALAHLYCAVAIVNSTQRHGGISAIRSLLCLLLLSVLQAHHAGGSSDTAVSPA